jgi:transposase-like protein
LSLLKRRRFPVEIILLCVRWYCKYSISYRDLAEMTQERGVEIDPSTIFDLWENPSDTPTHRYQSPFACAKARATDRCWAKI